MTYRLSVYFLLIIAVVGAPEFDPGGYPSLTVLPLDQRQVKPPDVDVEVWPTGLIDAERSHYLNRGTVTPMIFALANPLGRDLDKAWLVFDLPAGVELATVNAYLNWGGMATEEIRVTNASWTRYRLPLITHQTTFPKGRGRGAWYGRYRPPTIWLKTALPASAKPGAVRYQLCYTEKGSGLSVDAPLNPGGDTDAPPNPGGGFDEPVPGLAKEAEGKRERFSPLNRVDIVVIPRASAVQPKEVGSGVMGRFVLNSSRPDFDAGAFYASYLKELGYSYWVTHLSAPPEAGVDVWRESVLNNGFTMGTAEVIPDDLSYRGKNEVAGKALAPHALLGNDPWVQEHVWGALKNRQEAGLWSNWEPYGYMDNPDLSEPTMRAFAAYAKLPLEQVRAGWPDGVREQHAATFKRFYNDQLGQIAKRFVGEVGPLALAMSNDAIWATTENHGCSAMEWGDFAYTLQTWNYYHVPKSEGPWPIGDRVGAAQVVRSAGLTSWLDQQYGADRQVWLGCLYGWDQTGGDGFYLPEQLGFLHLSTILAGMDNAQNYAEFPIWDGRYAVAMAEANTRIARWESFIRQGVRERQHVVIPVTPYPQSIPADANPADQSVEGWAQPGYLWSYEYRLDNQRLIAIANTWDNGDVFCTLCVPNLPDGSTWALTEPDARRFFVNMAGSPRLTSADLAAGITVHVGAARWGTFLLVPATNTLSRGRAITAKEMAKLVDARQP